MSLVRPQYRAAILLAAPLLVSSCSSDDSSGEGSPSVPAVTAGSTAALNPTWHRDVAPLLSEKCTACHTEGGIAPFSLKNYDSAKGFAKSIASAVEEGRMPPFLAQDTADCKPRMPWYQDLRLSAEQKALLRAWADQGATEGDLASATPLKAPLTVGLEREDIVMPLPSEVTVSGSKDVHTCAIVDPKLAQDSYIVGRLITSGNAKVLHHVVSYVIAPGQVSDPASGMRTRTKAELEDLIKTQKGVGIGGMYECFGGPGLQEPVQIEMLDAWAPGGTPNLAPANSGQPISKDALVVMDIHYHPTGGTAEKDSTTKLSLMLATQKPTLVSRTVLIGNFVNHVSYMNGDGDLLKQPDEAAPEFLIPANAKDHIEESTWTWKLPTSSIRMYAAGTHMHYVGRGMRITVDHAAPDSITPANECLIETPSWDFNWQRGYGYDTTYENLPVLANGDVMHFRCVYDNTMGNRFVARALEDQGLSAPKDVRLGEDTLDEMCLGGLGVIYPNL